MIFYIHGWHKLEGWIAWRSHGTPCLLLDEVAGMGVPMPIAAAAAAAATIVQFVCSLLVVVGLGTRVNAALLAIALAGAVAQNLLAGRDPQLALLYLITVISLAMMGGGEWSLDANLRRKPASLSHFEK